MQVLLNSTHDLSINTEYFDSVLFYLDNLEASRSFNLCLHPWREFIIKQGVQLLVSFFNMFGLFDPLLVFLLPYKYIYVKLTPVGPFLALHLCRLNGNFVIRNLAG